eukprot:6093456-Alexandrium_andersonii.AAC.1
MDIGDFITHHKNKGKSEQWAMDEWKRLLNTDVDMEGEGPTAKMWVSLNRTRMRDRTRYIDSATEQGSRQLKNPSSKDVQDLLTFTGKQDSSFSESFLRDSKATGEAKSSSESPATPGSASASTATAGGRAVEVAIDAPRQQEKLTKQLGDLEDA